VSGSLNKIMYVEDEPDIQAIAKLALEAVGGYNVMVCSSGQEALQKVNDFEPDLFLLDVMMPEMDGPTTLMELRKLDKFDETPALFLTAKVMPSEIDRFKSIGALDVIAKPFDPMSLAAQIQKIWDNR